MDTLTLIIEIYGYIGTVLVVVSMIMSSLVKLRIVNTIGSIVSGTYSLIIGSYPMVLMNGAIIIINLWGLRSLLGTKQKYDMVRTNDGDASLTYFLNYYLSDIQVYFPEFSVDNPQADTVFFTYCSGEMAGVLLGSLGEDGALTVTLDYTTPKYRDCSIGKHMFAVLPQDGVHQLVVENPSEKHKPYLEKTGYQASGASYIKTLD